MINALYHAASSTTVQFSANPLRGNAEKYSRTQNLAYNSDGSVYVYSKNSTLRREQTIIFSRQSSTVLTNAINFMQARNGDRDSFVWYDHSSVSHTVRFAGRINYREIAPGKYRIELKIVEDV